MSDFSVQVEYYGKGVRNGAAIVLLRCLFTYNDTSFQPQPPVVEIRRLKSGSLESKTKMLAVQGGPSAQSLWSDTVVDGKLAFTLSSPPTAQGLARYWEFFIVTTPLSSKNCLEIWAGKTAAQEQVCAVEATALQPGKMNTGAPVAAVLTPTPFPRLSVGLNRTAPPSTVRSGYRDSFAGSGDPNAISFKDAAPLQALLHRIYVLLDSPDTLTQVWQDQYMAAGIPYLTDATFATQPIRTAEEMWARRVTEMLILTPYGRPINMYGGTDAEELQYCGGAVARGSSAPFYGLSFACQHLATFGVLSRGQIQLSTQLNAGHSAGSTCIGSGGQWWIDVTNPRVATASDIQNLALTEGPKDVSVGSLLLPSNNTAYGPGAVHLFSNRRLQATDAARYAELNRHHFHGVVDSGSASTIATAVVGTKKGQPVTRNVMLTVKVNNEIREHQRTLLAPGQTTFAEDNQPNAHIGFVLRTEYVPALDPNQLGHARMQMFDTGGMRVAGREQDVRLFDSSNVVGNYDDPGTLEVHSGTDPFRGTGIWPVITDATASSLRDHVVNVLGKARPLGFARFALVSRTDSVKEGNVRARIALNNYLVFATPLLLMHDPSNEAHNYDLCRYAWSLRDMPSRNRYEGLWLIYTPRGALSAAMRSASRASTVADIANAAYPSAAGGVALWQRLADGTVPLCALSVRADGTVRRLGSSRNAASFIHPLCTLEGRGQKSSQEPPLRLDEAFRATGLTGDVKLSGYLKGADVP
jgi:hypothetical protein